MENCMNHENNGKFAWTMKTMENFAWNMKNHGKLYKTWKPWKIVQNMKPWKICMKHENHGKLYKTWKPWKICIKQKKFNETILDLLQTGWLDLNWTPVIFLTKWMRRVETCLIYLVTVNRLSALCTCPHVCYPLDHQHSCSPVCKLRWMLPDRRRCLQRWARRPSGWCTSGLSGWPLGSNGPSHLWWSKLIKINNKKL